MGKLLRSNLNFWKGRLFKCFSGWDCNLPCSSKTSGVFPCNDGASNPVGSFLLVCVSSLKRTKMILELRASSSKLLTVSLLLLGTPDYPFDPGVCSSGRETSPCPQRMEMIHFTISFLILPLVFCLSRGTNARAILRDLLGPR